MSFIYITADKIGTETGGGLVTYHESLAMEEYAQSCGEKIVKWGKEELEGGSDPWGWDKCALEKLKSMETPKLAHFYSGSFTNTVSYLKSKGCKVGYTCAAHRVQDSKKAHEDLGIAYNFPHLTDPDLWRMYSGGYWNCDVLIVPSKHSKLVVNEQMDGLAVIRRPEVKIIPHGCRVNLVKAIAPLPESFTVGYLGEYGPDKGVRFLLEAWRLLRYRGCNLVLGGRNSNSDWCRRLVSIYGGGNIYLAGWQKDKNYLFDCSSVYVQPSATEGFGISVVEAMAAGRAVLCSESAGAVDLVHPSCVLKPCDSVFLAQKIDEARTTWDLMSRGERNKEIAAGYSWEKIRENYQIIWKETLSGKV